MLRKRLVDNTYREIEVIITDITEITEREDEETAEVCRLNLAAAQAGLRYAAEEKLQIKLLKVTVSETKLFSGFSSNDYMRLYITVLTEREGSVATAVREAENRPDTDVSASRRNNISLQDTATTTMAAREAEEDVTMKVILLWLINTAAFNLAFLTVTETAAAS
ncbi:uncharacterized protein BDCG_16444 [Blastomyces dermatitidis ER-3]|uniref:Uncharacterized protein n=1 Tax=Ajellomyces dermatitidis (strain ER-3 / ATCC MYA-2586) TaxID=559297 RepID=A0ABX2VTR8_AJEDR|nr:uncharacterized protein BDCG_16444 [Blastomyces dermatitidis ER-3]OAT00063.1 hypothetical protein BDCG_16444 [Blastomyces dermatitidis ER-3]